MTEPIPSGFSSITSHIIIKGCSNAIEFYKKAFDAVEIYKSLMPQMEE
ncbi:hypothetical protein [Nitrosopumilus sp.]